MGFFNLFLVALMPVVEVLLITLIGLFLAIDRINLLGPEATNHLNNIVFYLLGPSLVASSLAGTVTFKSFITLWFMPVNIFLTFLIGSVLGWILVKVTKTPPHIRGIVITCCSAGNLGNLLLIIVPAVCNESNNPFGETCSTYAEAYASLSMAIGAIYIWLYAYPIVRTYANPGDSNNSQDCSRQDDLQINNSNERMKVSVFERVRIVLMKIELKKVVAPSVIAAGIGFIIGTIAPIRKVLIGDSAPLQVVDTSASFIGKAAIPCMTLIMGANLLKGLKGPTVKLSVLIGVVTVRNIMLPLIGIGIVKAAHRFGLVGSDSLYQFILMLQFAVPPAMSLGTMTQLFQRGQGENSVIILATYAVASISLTLWSTLFMWLLA